MPKSGKSHFVRALTVAVLVPLLGLPPGLCAQTHVVSLSDLRSAAVSAAASRQHNLESVNRFLSSPRAEKSFSSAGVDATQLKAAVATLDDAELARLASRSDQIQADFAAGRLTDRDILLILLGFAALILIIVAVR